MVFTSNHVRELRENGYVIVEGFLDQATIDRTLEQLFTTVATWEQWRDDTSDERPQPMQFLSFPYKTDASNDITVRPDLIAFAEEAIGTDVVLAHSEMLCKYASEFDFDQPMHMDYRNNTLVVPPPDTVDQLASITYYTDVSMDLGPTRVVSYPDSEQWAHKPVWSKEEAPELFERERAVTVKAGSILLYTTRTFHRGSSFTAKEGARFSHHIAYQPKAMTWGGWRSFPVHGDQPLMGELLSRLSVKQRSVIGFPDPGDPYWTPVTLEAVQARYPAMDLEPYRALVRDTVVA